MYTDREEFEGWMQRIMQRFDLTEKLLERVLQKNSVNSHYSEVEALVYPTNRIGKLTLYIHTACALRHSSDLSKITSFLLQDV